MKSKKWLIFLGIGLVVIGLVFREIKSWNDDDFKVAVVGDSGIMMRSISWQRGMVNELWVDGKVPIWVPEGMGWYESEKIRKLLIQEKKENLAGEVMFYNFGFIPDMVIFGDDQNWLQNPGVVEKWGVSSYLRFLMLRSKMMVKSETIKTNLATERDLFNEIIQRDFADSRLLREDLKLTIYNSGQSSGLANFMGRVLEWSGFTVVGIDNYSEDVGKCKILYGEGVEGSYGFKIIKKEFGSCEYQQSQNVNEKEAELYFGDGYSQMLNYPSYINQN
jgi:hypothetical protein